jgi:large subunit ribosomal protein L31
MKSGIHPEYRYVIFQDVACGASFRIRSTMKTDKTTSWEDGQQYPLVLVDSSSASHPFFTGGSRLDTAEGRVAKFRKRYTAKAAAK